MSNDLLPIFWHGSGVLSLFIALWLGRLLVKNYRLEPKKRFFLSVGAGVAAGIIGTIALFVFSIEVIVGLLMDMTATERLLYAFIASYVFSWLFGLMIFRLFNTYLSYVAVKYSALFMCSLICFQSVGYSWFLRLTN